MATVVLADNAYGTIASALTAADTTLTFTTGHGARFPAVSSASLYCVLIDSSNVVEEIIITAHSASADTATITRAAGSTTAKAWSAGARIEARLSSSALEVAYSSTSVQTLTNKTLTSPIINTGTLASPIVTGTATMSAAVVDGIGFPAVQISSTATNVLDDYEEGPWTPTVGGSTTYAQQNGDYTKIGRLVFISGKLEISTIGTGTDVTTTVHGLPFANKSNGAVAIAVDGCVSASTAVVSVSAGIAAGASSIVFRSRVAASISDGPNDIFKTNTTITFSGCYQTT